MPRNWEFLLGINYSNEINPKEISEQIIKVTNRDYTSHKKDL